MNLQDFNSAVNDIITDTIYTHLPGKKTKVGNRVNCKCFICGDHATSSAVSGWFYLNNDPISYYCFNERCTANGITLLAAMLNVSKQEAKQVVFTKLKSYSKNKNKIIINDQEVTTTPTLPIIQKEELILPNYWVDLPEDAHTFLNNRKIFEAPFKPKNWKLYYSTKHKRIAIPWSNYGKIETYQYRALYKSQTPKYLFKSGNDKPIFGLDTINSEFKYLFLIEGVFDSIFCKNGLAIGGVNMVNSQKEILDGYFEYNKVFLLDNQFCDKASYDKSLELLQKGESVFIFPKSWEGIKDINDAYLHFGKNYFEDENFLTDNIFTGLKGIAKLKFMR